MTDEQFVAWIRSAPEDAAYLAAMDTEQSYGEAPRWLAGRYVRLMDRGASPESNLWALAKREATAAGREVMAEFSGFMAGWAENAARKVMQLAAKPNPAIVHIEC